MTIRDITFSRANPAFLTAALFTATIFLSASLLFFIQPLFTRIVLPQIGGAPAVWTTAMLFFQAVLIGGYLYAHLTTRYLPVRAQLSLHLAMWAAALAFLPLAVPDGWQYDARGSAEAQSLMLYLGGVGLPFLVLSANAPLIQTWYGQSRGPSADDPYFLYGASNLGSLIALLGFPLVAEPLFGITAIGKGFAGGFVLLGIALLACGLNARRNARHVVAAPPADAASAEARVGMSRVARWTLLAFIPSSLMLGVTFKISTDLGAIPLIWAVPLSLYLLSFVLTFGPRQALTAARLRPAAMPAVAVLVVLASGLSVVGTSWAIAGILLVVLFVVSLLSHRLLYESRPGAADLTLFYLVMSGGGALGGVFNSLIAPVFLAEPLELAATAAVTAALLLRPGARPIPREIVIGAACGAGLFLLCAAVRKSGLPLPTNAVAVLFSAALTAGLWWLRERGFAALMTALVLVGLDAMLLGEPRLLADRSFFGTHVVQDDRGMRLYINGSTTHGMQALSELDAPWPTPVSYYYPTGPLGQVMRSEVGARANDRHRRLGGGCDGLLQASRSGLALLRNRPQSRRDRAPQRIVLLPVCLRAGRTHAPRGRAHRAGTAG